MRMLLDERSRSTAEPPPSMTRIRFRAKLAAAIAVALASASAARGIVFNCAAGDTACLINSMRQASPTGSNTIRLAAAIYQLTAVDNVATEGPVGTPQVTKQITIQGVGAGSTIIQRDPSAPDFRLFQIQQGGILTLRDLTIQGGHLDGMASPYYRTGVAGGVGALNAGILVLTNAEVLQNRGELLSSEGGGIRNLGDLGIAGSRIEGNIVDSNGAGIYNGGTIEITRTTIRNNNAFFQVGGGIFNAGTGTILNSSITSNHAGRAAAVISGNDLTIIGTTISRNGGDIEGVVEVVGGTLRFNNTTISDNTQLGLSVTGGRVELRNSVLAGNFYRLDDPPRPADCLGAITSLGNNVIGDTNHCTITLLPTDRTGDARLGPLTEGFKGADGLVTGNSYMPPLAGSPVIDGGDPGSCWPSDQMVRPRTDGDLNGSVICDIGAVEYVPTLRWFTGEERLEDLLKKKTGRFAKAGVMTIREKYTNKSDRPVANPVAVVRKLTEGFYLLSAERPPGVVGSRQRLKAGKESTIAPGESVIVEFRIGLANREPFDFVVEIEGYPH